MKNFYTQVPPKYRQGLWPYLGAGISIVLLIFGLILFSYLLIFGALVGGVLFLIAWIRQKFFSPKVTPEKEKLSHHTYEYDPKTGDWREP